MPVNLAQFCLEVVTLYKTFRASDVHNAIEITHLHCHKVLPQKA